jgi:hypothetical protein
VSGERNPLVRNGEDHWPDAGSAGWQQLRRLYDGAAQRLARAHLRSTIAALDAAGHLANLSALHGPSRSEVAALYDWLPRRSLGTVARDIAALHFKNRAAIALVQSGGTRSLSEVVRWASEAARDDLFQGEGARLIVACHVGAFFGIRAALETIERPALTLRDLPMGDPASRARALKRAVDVLRQGGLVIATLDGPGGTSTGEVECLGRRIVLRRGPFTLARITGAPMVPVVCAWTRQGRIEMRIAPAVGRPAAGERVGAEFEDLMAIRAARWIDQYLRSQPQEIWLSTLRHYIAAPLATAPRSATVDLISGTING